MAAPDPRSSRDYFHLFVRLSSGNADVFGGAAFPFGRGIGADRFDGAIFCELLARAEICEPVRMEFAGSWSDFGNCAGENWNAAPVEDVALRTYRAVCGGSIFSGAIVAGKPQMAGGRSGRSGAAICGCADRDCGGERGSVVGTKRRVEKRVPREESGAFDGNDGRRGRRAKREIFSEFGADARREKYTGKILHAVAGVRALPRRFVQTVVQLGAPFFFVQQSVVPEKHRVYAGRGGREEFEMVRGMP